MNNLPAHQQARTRIYELMKQEGIWTYLLNTKVYTVQEMIERVEAAGGKLSPELETLITKHISRVQVYFDDRILESKIEYDLPNYVGK